MSVRAALKGGTELNILDGASGMTLLMLASAACQDNIVELLLRRQADVNAVQKNGMTALMHACEQASVLLYKNVFLCVCYNEIEMQNNDIVIFCVGRVAQRRHIFY